MEYTLEIVIFYLLLLDSVVANLLAWTEGRAWYRKNFRIFSRWFPLTRGWTTYYLVLVLWLGFVLYRFGVPLF